MKELLLFFPVLILSCLVLSALHFDDLDLIVAYAWRNILQLLGGAAVLILFLVLVTP